MPTVAISINAVRAKALRKIAAIEGLLCSFTLNLQKILVWLFVQEGAASPVPALLHSFVGRNGHLFKTSPTTRPCRNAPIAFIKTS
jgi:hypothetical protein